VRTVETKMFGYCFKMSIYYSEYLSPGRPDYVILLTSLQPAKLLVRNII